MGTKLTLVELVKVYSVKIKDGRNPYYVLSKVMEEVGELATEVAIHQGDSYKKPGKDGIMGEAVDVMLSVLDLIYLIDPKFMEMDLTDVASLKCKKWDEKVAEFKKHHVNDDDGFFADLEDDYVPQIQTKSKLVCNHCGGTEEVNVTE